MRTTSSKNYSFKLSSITLVLLTMVSLTGCPNNDRYAPSPYDSGYGYDYDRNDYDRRRDYERRRDLDRERERLEDERERLENERERRDNHRYEKDRHNNYRPAPTPSPREERCPSGFSPSEKKCSSDERKRGCRDMRLPGGLGCVSR